MVLSGIQSSAKVSTADNGQYGLAGKGSALWGGDERRGVALGGLGWEEGVVLAVVH